VAGGPHATEQGLHLWVGTGQTIRRIDGDGKEADQEDNDDFGQDAVAEPDDEQGGQGQDGDGLGGHQEGVEGPPQQEGKVYHQGQGQTTHQGQGQTQPRFDQRLPDVGGHHRGCLHAGPQDVQGAGEDPAGCAPPQDEEFPEEEEPQDQEKDGGVLHGSPVDPAPPTGRNCPFPF